MQEPFITVVIPVYNRAKIVKETLQSLADQTLQVFDIVLVDNNSSDNTLEVLTQWATEHNRKGRRVTVLTEPKRGACAARNTGLQVVQTPWVMFFDSDDLMLPNHLADFEAAARRTRTAELITRPVFWLRPNGKYVVTRKNCVGDKNDMFKHLFHSTLATQRYIVKTDLVRKIGGWDNKVWAWNDYELGLRLLLQNPVIEAIPLKPSMAVIPQKESITGTSYSTSPRKWEDALDVCQRDLEEAGRHDLVKYIDCRRAILAAVYAQEGAKREARRLRSKVRGWRYKAVYLHQRILRHGATFTVRLLFG